MVNEMNLITLKEGGRFAMSWIAGTNPKHLRSNFQRQDIYSVDVQKVCEDMIESMKNKEDTFSFRILFRLCFGTIRIYAEQVQHLYYLTFNFVCFNKCVMKQYSLKRLSSTVDDDSSRTKRIRLESTEDFYFSSLLSESEIFDVYDEDNFKFPNETAHSNGNGQSNTSTCIQVKEITIQNDRWDHRMFKEEDEDFGNATEDERSMLLSGLKDSYIKVSTRKRKPCYSTPECSPLKRPCFPNESVDDIRYANKSTYNETISEWDINSPFNQTIQDSDQINTTADINFNDITQSDFESKQQDGATLPKDHQLNGQKTNQYPIDHYSFEVSNDIRLTDMQEEHQNQSNDDESIETLTFRAGSPLNSSFSLEEITPSNSSFFNERKRKRLDKLIIDSYTKIRKTNFDNVWEHCFDINSRDHLARLPIEHRKPIVFSKRMGNGRLKSQKLLSSFNKNLKLRLKQNIDNNRRLIVEEILGTDDYFDENKNLFKIKTNCDGKIMESRIKPNSDKIPRLDNSNKENDWNTTNLNTLNDHNNNIQIEDLANPSQFTSNENHKNRHETRLSNTTLKCSLSEIDSLKISFDFPVEAGSQRSEWGKESIMKKLLFAWISQDANINIKSIIVGANRMNAAVAFHTLLDLSAQQYIEIVKDKCNTIESIKMGPEMIKKINESLE